MSNSVAADKRAGVSVAGVSVVVPCRDAAPFVTELLDSLITQTVRPAEVIVVDDGSTDGSAAVIETWCATNPDLAVTVIPAVAAGVGAAMRRGIAASQMPLIARADADDRLEPRWLERLVGALEANPAAGYSYPAMRMFGDATGRYHTREFSAPALVFAGNFVCAGALMRRSAYDQTRGVADLPAWEDWDLWLSFLEVGQVGVLVDEELYLWRRHGGTRNRLSWLRRRRLRLAIWWRHRRLIVRYAASAPRELADRIMHPVRLQ